MFDLPLKMRDRVHELFVPHLVNGKPSKYVGKCDFFLLDHTYIYIQIYKTTLTIGDSRNIFLCLY